LWRLFLAAFQDYGLAASSRTAERITRGAQRPDDHGSMSTVAF
jgi:hypothetical protein